MPAATIRYMGSKRSLAPSIASLIHESHPKSTVVDVFAGTCAIGTALAPSHRVLANDVHAFATLVARALLVTPGPVPSLATALRELQEPFRANLQALKTRLGDRLDAETRALVACAQPDGWTELRDAALQDAGRSIPLEIPLFSPLESYRASPRQAPYALFSLYFSNSYFGVQQAAEIDSLRFAIDQAPQHHRDFYLLALLNTVSHCAATPGHFAQFLVPRDATNTRFIARIRRRSPFRRFLETLNEIAIPKCFTRATNSAFQSEATDFVLATLGNVPAPLVIYADPPYSRAQYSRYYHVLETLVLYDYPNATGKGRYRSDRFNTAFSRKSGVSAAFDELVSASANVGATLYLSYPQNGLYYQNADSMLDVLLKYYPKASIVSQAELAHSTMGGAPGTASVNVNEEVYRAEW